LTASRKPASVNDRITSADIAFFPERIKEIEAMNATYSFQAQWEMG